MPHACIMYNGGIPDRVIAHTIDILLLPHSSIPQSNPIQFLYFVFLYFVFLYFVFCIPFFWYFWSTLWLILNTIDILLLCYSSIPYSNPIKCYKKRSAPVLLPHRKFAMHCTTLLAITSKCKTGVAIQLIKIKSHPLHWIQFDPIKENRKYWGYSLYSIQYIYSLWYVAYFLVPQNDEQTFNTSALITNVVHATHG